jgi:hypothetical protein
VPCTGALSGMSVGALVVPAGASCSLSDTVVKGSIRVRAGAELVTDDSAINGSVIGFGAKSVRIVDTDVVGTGTAGNINLSGTTGPIVIGSDGCAVDPATGNNINLINNHGTIAICFMTVGETVNLQNNHDTIGVFHNVIGNPLIVQHNVAPFVRLRGNEVGLTGGGSMVVHHNATTGSAKRPDGLRVVSNYSHNRMNCHNNSDAPVGRDNSADNGLFGQCTNL